VLDGRWNGLQHVADQGGHRGVGARMGPPRLRVVRAGSPYHGGAGRVRRALSARGHAQSAECRSSRIGDKPSGMSTRRKATCQLSC
jgi:hypothetical protein